MVKNNFKCWKKANRFKTMDDKTAFQRGISPIFESWKNVGNNDRVNVGYKEDIFPQSKKHNYYVNTQAEHQIRGFKTQMGAKEFANKYMKRNDDC